MDSIKADSDLGYSHDVNKMTKDWLLSYPKGNESTHHLIYPIRVLSMIIFLTEMVKI